MSAERKSYPDDHWLMNRDPAKVLESYMDQQSKAYSKTKNAFIRELAGDLRGKRVLDYGCGAGLFAAYAARQGAKTVVGVDAEETALAAARLLADREGVSSACAFVQSDQFPRLAETTRFDVVLLKDVIEHVHDDESLIAAAAAALVPGGRLVLSTQNALSLNYMIEGSYNRLWVGRRDWMGWDPTHVRFYTPMNLGRKLRRAGLRSFSWRSVYLIPYRLPGLPGSGRQFLRLDALAMLDRTLGSIFPYNRLGWNILVRAHASPLVPNRVSVARPVPIGLASVPVL
jgi:2-polyprenyl-6-hydroxyphenyl methylase / 3-demethylubiquinone-9 3-methyltransferase